VHLNIDEVRSVAAQFQGTIEQMPRHFPPRKLPESCVQTRTEEEEVCFRRYRWRSKSSKFWPLRDQATFRARVGSGTIYGRWRTRWPEARVRGASGQLATDYSRRVRHRRCAHAASAGSRNAAGNCESLLCIHESWRRSYRALAPPKKRRHDRNGRS